MFTEIVRASDTAAVTSPPTPLPKSFLPKALQEDQSISIFPKRKQTQKEAACLRLLPNRWGD